MPRITTSIHGNAFCSEQYRPLFGYDLVGNYVQTGAAADWGDARGWGRTFTLSGWYHVAIPTPMYVDGQAYYLDEVIILHSKSDRMVFDEVHLYIAGSFIWRGVSDIPPPNLLFRPRQEGGARFQTNGGVGVSLHFSNTGGPDDFVTFRGATATFTD